MTTTKANEIRNADTVLVADGHPEDGTWEYRRINGDWYFEGDVNEDPSTDAEMVKCNDVLKAWAGGRLLFDRLAEFTASFEADDEI